MLALVLQAVATDPVPSDNNVKAGWVAFGVVIILIVAVVFLLRSFTRQIKKVEAADAAGVYDDPSSNDEPSSTPAEQDR